MRDILLFRRSHFLRYWTPVVQYNASLLGSTSHPFIIRYFILVAHSQFDLVMGLFQVKKKNQPKKKKKNKQKRRKCPEMAFRPSHWDCSIRICCSHQSHCGIRFFKRKIWSFCWWSEVNLLNSSGNWLLILIQVIQIIETEFPIYNLQKTFTTEFENIREIILITALIHLRPSEDCWVIVSTSSWRSFNNIHFTIGK